MQLSKETIEATRAHFADIAYGCIREVIDGTVKVNDPEAYCAERELDALQYTLGRWDHTLAFRQYATYLQTGVMHALLP
ncbi:MAG: hypothetical protein G3W63_19715 [Xanthomonas euvesicatoria]|uniref:Uncharacterized protein n=3 Tax=root TaxID=1 RepID=A0A3G1GLE6_9CAUD|nr:hypothetical protein KEM13_gp21 [Xanthomonas phage KPhi1]YP_010052633.1 hypothetical protein KEM14_gp09 [Xanthomonas virus phiXaf18]NEK74988.1 hypothetical protein [Xanthomonas euvesicatoria]UGL62886.1 hypothetical protein [Xanthomonas phage MYK3]UUW40395.1 hypothetical protein [Xanthomonas phage BsXeu269p/3]APQ41900.1 hypothetical protein K1pha_21 [Xanthomonas phage KPhi1]NEK91720.1 hypothetical protein [Xanthomonas euvesicatoria]